MSDKVFVTGIGIISAIGNNAGEVLNSLNLSATGIGFTSYLNTIHKNELPVAEVKASNEELLEIATPCDNLAYTRTALLGMIAAKEAVISSGIKDISEKRTGLVSATSVGGMDKSEYFFSKFIKDNKAGKLKDIITHDCGDSTEKIADFLGVKDYITTISTACSSSANSIMFGARLIKNGILDRVIAGGTDSLTKFTLNGFNTLMILDKTGCKPFDNNRNGLTLGEGAGFLVLESERAANSANKEILCELKGYNNSCDAYHQTASSPEGYGAYLAMKGAIDMSRLSTDEIDYINAHGTGTVNNDLSEGNAIEKIFGSEIPKLSSSKGFTGHTLGAAGGIEAVLSVLSIINQTIFPNLNFTQQMKELSFSPVTNLLKNIEVKNVLSNSFGFGGNNTTLIFSKV
ncbi:MAG: beta-ketoacyl-[acyl-carrier-protein] synthase family protein [Bacteroidales bacterium]|nr:beta-ketoacyl-[acyl-carrier-protein] synthase family protein [Bacteroidales bacterium]